MSDDRLLARTGSVLDGWRKRFGTAAVALVVVAGVLVSASLAMWWARHAVLDESTWTRTSSALTDDPTVRADVAETIAQQIVEALDLEDRLGTVLPGPLSALSGLLTDGAAGALTTATERVVGTETFAAVWDRAVRAIHREFVAVVTGEEGFTALNSDGLVLDVGASLTQIRDALSDRGITLLDGVEFDNVRIEVLLIDAPGLDRLRTFVDVLDVLVIVLPIVAVIALAAGLTLGDVRRRGGRLAIGAGAGLLGGAALVLVVATVLERSAVEALQGGVLGEASAAIVVDAVLSDLEWAMVVTGAVAVVAVVVGVLLELRARPTGPDDSPPES